MNKGNRTGILIERQVGSGGVFEVRATHMHTDAHPLSTKLLSWSEHFKKRHTHTHAHKEVNAFLCVPLLTDGVVHTRHKVARPSAAAIVSASGRCCDEP